MRLNEKLSHFFDFLIFIDKCFIDLAFEDYFCFITFKKTSIKSTK